jgi:hypothetical protein
MNLTGRGTFRRGPDPRRHLLTPEEREDGGRQRGLQMLAEQAEACGMLIDAFVFREKFHQRQTENWGNRKRPRKPKHKS